MKKFLFVLFVTGLWISPAFAEKSAIEIAKEIGVDQKLDAQLPLDAPFVDEAGKPVQPGTPIGHPSCQGFYLSASATHLHIARRYNGEWIPADCWACAPSVPAPPFVLSGWRVKGYPYQIYQGWMEKDGQIRRAEQGRDDPSNQVSW